MEIHYLAGTLLPAPALLAMTEVAKSEEGVPISSPQ